MGASGMMLQRTVFQALKKLILAIPFARPLNERFDVFDPATGEVIATAADSKAVDVEVAVDAARRSFDDGGWWPGTPARERGRKARQAGAEGWSGSS